MDCYFWWDVLEADDTCSSILDDNDISIDYFYKWNPSVKSDCTALQQSVSYCVMGPRWKDAMDGLPRDLVTTTTTALPSSTSCGTVQPPLLTQARIPCKCNKFAPQEDGKYCSDLAQDAGITIKQFYEYNPAVRDSC
ncbi:hypothetical protein VE03_07273 [Pseudogymnoascus sp. 23342-1-I1]|nr:hypothetical protein VE03_07273 [Pseudogymnoascus sp. 23342-1-I1]